MLEYWMASNQSVLNASNEAIEEILRDPGAAHLFAGYPPWLLNFAASCCVLFMLIGIPGNLITVIALFRTKKLRNSTAIFIMNLSTSDLMFCCFNLPLATSTFWHSSWPHGALLCRLFPLLRYGLVAVSLFTILAITINRYVMIGYPRLYPKLYKRKYLIPMVLATWTFGFGALIATWLGQWGRFGLDPAIGSCSILPDASGRSPKEFLFVLAFLMPCMAIVVCYARIFFIVHGTAKKSGRRRRPGLGDSGDAAPDRRSATPRNIDEELSALGSSCNATALCGSFSPRQTSSTLSCKIPSNSQISSKFVVEDSSLERPPVYQQAEEQSKEKSREEGEEEEEEEEEEVIEEVIASRGDELQGFSNLQDDNEFNFEHDALDDIPYADDREEDSFLRDTFLCRRTSRNEGEVDDEPTTTSVRDKFERIVSRGSFVVDSGLWVQRIVENEKLTQSQDLGIISSSIVENLEDQGMEERRRKSKIKIFRRESKYKSVDRGRNAEMIPRMSTKDKKLLKMILVIFSSFLICYLPITLTKIFKDAIDWRGLNIAGYILIYLTTCINPVIYVVMSSEYRRAYKSVLLCRVDSIKPDKPMNVK